MVVCEVFRVCVDFAGTEGTLVCADGLGILFDGSFLAAFPPACLTVEFEDEVDDSRTGGRPRLGVRFADFSTGFDGIRLRAGLFSGGACGVVLRFGATLDE